jgi:hypothetical protein
MTIEAMKQALEALETCMYPQQKQIQAITSLRQAIEQAEKQEPVAYQNTQEKCRIETVPAQGGLLPTMQEGKDFTITHPQPQREWVGLTQQDIDIAFDDTQEGGGFNEFAEAIEAKLKEKNT